MQTYIAFHLFPVGRKHTVFKVHKYYGSCYLREPDAYFVCHVYMHRIDIDFYFNFFFHSSTHPDTNLECFSGICVYHDLGIATGWQLLWQLVHNFFRYIAYVSQCTTNIWKKNHKNVCKPSKMLKDRDFKWAGGEEKVLQKSYYVSFNKKQHN